MHFLGMFFDFLCCVFVLAVNALNFDDGYFSLFVVFYAFGWFDTCAVVLRFGRCCSLDYWPLRGHQMTINVWLYSNPLSGCLATWRS